MRPEGVNDLEVIWAIRNIPQSIISKANELCLLFLFVSIIGNRPSCWYNLDQLSEKARLSKNTLKKVLKSLLDKNLISIKKPEKYGRGISSEYTLNYQKILNASKTPVDNSEQKGSNSDAFNEERDQNLNKKESNSDPLERYKERHKEKRGEKPSFFPSVQQPKPKRKITRKSVSQKNRTQEYGSLEKKWSICTQCSATISFA
jgi:DNA-binding MarR family transcriptional regulator